jgi:superkiller protein 3
MAEAGRYQQAEPEYFRAIELNPNDGEAYRRLGQVYEDNNQLDKALAAYRQAVQVEPGNLWTHQSLGTFYLHRARFTEAIEAYLKMAARWPELPEVHYVLALAYNNLGRFAEAEKELQISIRLGDSSKTEHELGYTLMHEGKDEEAIKAYKKALELGPQTDRLTLPGGPSERGAAGVPDRTQIGGGGAWEKCEQWAGTI